MLKMPKQEQISTKSESGLRSPDPDTSDFQNLMGSSLSKHTSVIFFKSDQFFSRDMRRIVENGLTGNGKIL